MRNLKRALSLTLASVMLLGMMVVGSSAAAGYDDVADSDNVEAIEVLQAIEVMVGDERGFGPERPVNRAEMAVVMGKLLSLDYNYYEATCPFNDVYDWARGWVGACYANGIVSGRGEGVYDPGTTVTAVEAASMLMRALGYFKYQSDYANGFEVSTVSQATKIRLFDGVNSKTNEPLTRNQVAQMALNALKTGVVEPDGNALNFVDSNGNVIATGGKINYVNVTSNKPFASAIGKVQATSVGSTNTGYIVDLGEQLYDGKLKLDDAIDDFGRPARRWEFDGKEIGSYAKKELMVFDNVGKVTGVDLYNLIGKATLDKYDLTVTVDGIDDFEVYDRIPYSLEDHVSNSCVIFDKTDLNRNNKAAIGGTGTGVLMQVFVDHETDDVYVAVINTYLARATKAYDDKKEEATIEVYALDKETQTGMYGKTDRDYDKKSTYSESFTLGNEDFSLVKDIEKDDPFLVTVAQGKIQSIEPAEVLSDVAISSFKKLDYVVSGGTQYNYTTTADYNYEDLYFYTSEDDVAVNLKEITYNIFLDAYGNLIGLEANEKPNNYVFLTSIDINGSNISNRTATANAIFLDGTVDTISINMNKSTWRDNRVNNDPSAFAGDEGDALLNTWATYSKSGDVYTIKEVWNVVEPAEGSEKAEAYRAPQYSKASGDEDANGTKLAQFRDTNDTDLHAPRTEITLKDGLRMYGGYTTNDNTPYSNVFGDSSSVYLTAEMGQVRDRNNRVYGVIKGVETVHTGIDGTSITIWDKQDAYDEAYKDLKIADMEKDDVAYGVYTLYNEKGIVIAAMVVGEGSSSSELVYVTSSDAKLESDNGSSSKAANDGLYTWTREVVRDGELVDLTEVGDKIDEISRNNMRQNEWYQVKVDGNGNVVKAEPAFYALDYYEYGDTLGRSAFTSEYEHINTVVEKSGVSTVLYHQDNGPVATMNEDDHDSKNEIKDYPCTHNGFNHNDELTVKGNNVLAVNTKTGSGIYFRNDVNVVLVYWNRNTKTTDVMLGEGVDDLKEMVDYVNENSKASVVRDGGRSAELGTTYYVSALIENGAATTIVIQDRYNPYAKHDHSTDIPSGEYTLTLGGIFNNTYTTVNNSDVYIVDKNTGNTTRLESIDDLGTATVNGFKRYEVPANATIRVLDKDVDTNFLPYFSPVHASSYYNYSRNINATNPYIEFTMKGEDLIVRQWQVGDRIYVDVSEVAAGVNVLINGVAYKAGTNDTVIAGDKITVTNADKVSIYGENTASYTVKGTEYVIDIVATKKGTVDPGKSYTFDVKRDEDSFLENAVYFLFDKDGKEIKAGDEIAAGTDVYLMPNEALKPEGITLKTLDNGKQGWTVDSNFTIVAADAEKYFWMDEVKAFGQVIFEAGWYDTDMNMLTYPGGGSRAALASLPLSANRFSVARAAETPDVEVDVDEAGKILVDGGKIKSVVPYGEKGSMTWIVSMVDGKIKVAFDPKAMTGIMLKDIPAAIRETVKKIDSSEATLYKVGGEDPTDPSTDPNASPIRAVMKPASGNTLPVVFYAWRADKTKNMVLTDAQIVKAISELNPELYACTVDDVEWDAAKANCKVKTPSGIVTFSKANTIINDGNINDLYKVEYPGGVVYLGKNPGVKLKNVTAGVDWLLPETTFAGKKTNGLAVDSKKHESAAITTLSSDVKYVQAFELDLSKGDAAAYEWKVEKVPTTIAGEFLYTMELEETEGNLTGWYPADYGSGKAFELAQLNATIKLTARGAASRNITTQKGDIITITVNGEVFDTLTVDKDGAIPVTKKTLKVSGTNPDTDPAKFTLAFKIERPTAANIKVYLDDAAEPLTAIPTGDGTTYELGSIKGKTIAWSNVWGDLTAITADKTGGAGKIKIDDLDKAHVYTVSAAQAVDGVINLYSCYSVVDTGATTHAGIASWDVFGKYEDGVLGDDFASGTKLYKASKAPTLYIKNTQGNTIVDFCWAEDLTEIGTPSEAKDGSQVWAVKVDRNIEATSLAANVLQTNTALKLHFGASVIGGGTSTSAVDLAGLLFTSEDMVDDVIIDLNPGIEGRIEWDVVPTMTDGVYKLSIMFKNDGDAQIAANTDIGNLIITLANERVVNAAVATKAP